MVSAWGRRRRLPHLGGRQGIRRWHFDDLDPALLELAHERLLLEPVQLVGLDDLVYLRRPDRADVLAGLDQGPQIVLGEQGLDVNRRHGKRRGAALDACRYETPTVRDARSTPVLGVSRLWKIS